MRCLCWLSLILVGCQNFPSNEPTSKRDTLSEVKIASTDAALRQPSDSHSEIKDLDSDGSVLKDGSLDVWLEGALKPLPSAERIRPTDFAGSDSCEECHGKIYQTWKASSHGLAGGPPSEENVMPAFDGTPLVFADAKVFPRKNGHRYLFEVREEGRAPVEVEIVGTVGRGLMKGGGTQVYLQRAEDGRVLMLPFDYSVTDQKWFCQAKRGRGWEFISPDLKISDCEWPPWRGLGVTGGPNCQNCHGSQIEVAWQKESARYETSWASLTIDCESCHGPAGEHVENMRKNDANTAMVSLVGLSPKESLDLCFRCHSTKSVVAPGFQSGLSFNEYFAHTHLVDSEFAALDVEGKVKEFAYQEGHLSSACYFKGEMVCTDCHQQHSLGYVDVLGRKLSGWDDDGQCTGCHGDQTALAQIHGQHTTSTRCVNCHMPYWQHPGVGDAVTYRRSDHRISVPVTYVGDNAIAGTACLTCHNWTSTEERRIALESVYGLVRPRDSRVDGLKFLETLPENMTAREADEHLTSAAKLLSETLDWPVTKQVRLLTITARLLLVPGVRAFGSRELEVLASVISAMPFESRAAGVAVLLVAEKSNSGCRSVIERLVRNVRPKEERGFRRTIAFNLIALLMSYGFDDRFSAQSLVELLDRVVVTFDAKGPRIDVFGARTLAANGLFEQSFERYVSALGAEAFNVEPILLDKGGTPETIFSEMVGRFGERNPKGLEAVIERLPEGIRKKTELAELKCKLIASRGDYESAQLCLKQVSEAHPTQRGIHFKRATLLLELKRPVEALRALEKALAIDPNDRQAVDLYNLLKQNPR